MRIGRNIDYFRDNRIFYRNSYRKSLNSLIGKLELIIIVRLLFTNISNSEIPENSDSSDDTETPTADIRIQDLLLDFLISLLDDHFTDTEYSSPLISGLAILGLTEQDT